MTTPLMDMIGIYMMTMTLLYVDSDHVYDTCDNDYNDDSGIYYDSDHGLYCYDIWKYF